MANELITGWTYRKGELVQKRFSGWNILIAVNAALLISAVIVWPVMRWYNTTGAIAFGTSTVCLAVCFYLLLKANTRRIFNLYKKLFPVKEEEILFTTNKITSTNKTWILSDEIKELKQVSLTITGKAAKLNFKGTEYNPGKGRQQYNIHVPVPKEELDNARKVCDYFREKLEVNGMDYKDRSDC